MKKTWTVFDFGRANHLALATVVDDEDFNQQIGLWLSGRLLGFLVSILVPWRRLLDVHRGRIGL